MPTPLASLYRFFEHDRSEPNASEDNDTWVVSCGKFENDYRIYRIMFKSSKQAELNIDEERIIPIEMERAKSSLLEFIAAIYKVIQNTNYPIEYRRACHKLLKEDPWIEEFMSNYNMTVSSFQKYSSGS
jgi:hypothetical protein